MLSSIIIWAVSDELTVLNREFSDSMYFISTSAIYPYISNAIAWSVPTFAETK